MCVLGVMLGGTPDLVAGLKAKEGRGQGPPNELQNSDLWGERGVRAFEGGGAVECEGGR